MRRRNTVLGAAAAALALAAVALSTYLYVDRSLPTPEDLAPEKTGAIAEPETPPTVSVEEEGESERSLRVTLYMLSSTGKTLAPEEREVPLAASPQEQAKEVVRQLLAGSRRGRSSPFPPGVRLRDLFITSQGLAVVDLSKELVANHPGGVSGEELTVYSLANTLISNLPTVKKVQILVEGREISTLAGHLDLSIPYGRGPTWLEQNLQSSSGT